VNAVAFAGQLAFLREHLPWPLLGQVMMAVALESVAIYLAFHAHAAQLASDSALRLRLASYGFAAVIGAMNYSHYAAVHGRPTFPAVAVGLMSASSPWLWAIHSRRVSRDMLLASGQIEPHALRLGPTRWLWHPLRSSRVMWLATWEGITDPRDAVTRWEAARQEDAPTSAREVHPECAPVGVPRTAPRPALERAPGERTRRARGGRTRAQKRPRGAPTIEAAIEDAREGFKEEIGRGAVPSQRTIKMTMGVGQDRARQIHEALVNGSHDDLAAELATLQAGAGWSGGKD